MTEFPILASAAFSRLTTPATSVDCQRVLSLVSESPGISDYHNQLRKTDRLLLMLKAHLHKDLINAVNNERSLDEMPFRECKAWSNSELQNYGCCETSAADDYDLEEDPNWSMFKSDEEKTIADVVEPLLSFAEEDDFDNMKNRQ
ncbi:unnamed protein product [Strongylus vulgaris]|uniref:Uncharacterized protein n=1 Tax=Strongylus vulgaris TaxID=40348 RepID=A0A3P7J7R2_STRVU|nr:unnamed protein product [Strongylus vulgaris]